MRKLANLLWAFAFCPILSGQNLALNPGFEDLKSTQYHSPCTFSQHNFNFNETVAHWNTFMDLTPDIISYPDSGSCIFPRPFAGQRMAGFINYYPSEQTRWLYDYHEFLQGELREPLQPGILYEISFWANRQDTAALHHIKSLDQYTVPPVAVSSNNIGVAFMPNKASQFENFRASIRQFGIRPQVNTDSITAPQAGEWVWVKDTFRLQTAARYFVLGNFFSDARTLVNYEPDPLEVFPVRVAYYCIDEIYIGPPRADIATALTRTGTYTFRNLHFDSGSALLRQEALQELQGLARFLATRPSIHILIEGHTDEIGNNEDNLLLSKARAKSVCRYLEAQGIAPARLQYRGHGEEQPIADNQTAAGRQANRRVVCKVL
ncbi:OmpA family protein [Phaeodactylibacter luteus]|uniref:OmpA family protein n=1 Tax=Phaeodactylibacter luteus TaxID=1564516 RepID=A0A5C6RWF1_9BACT|nr:OmpA family protein [Phaeodactylibacter luteus]TXB66275.1 OmpA family protein [Phaeodactylibacter luteus]